MRTFHLHRYRDYSGMSGLGVVAEGVEFTDGTVVLRWLTGPSPATSIFADLKAMRAIHGHGGGSRVIYNDERAAVRG